MTEARDAASDELVVTRERPVVPRWQMGFTAAVAALLLGTLVTGGSWQTILVFGLVILSQLFVIAGRAERVVVDGSGITCGAWCPRST